MWAKVLYSAERRRKDGKIAMKINNMNKITSWRKSRLHCGASDFLTMYPKTPPPSCGAPHAVICLNKSQLLMIWWSHVAKFSISIRMPLIVHRWLRWSIFHSDLNLLVLQALLQMNPYHIDSLLQLSDVCRIQEDQEMARDLVGEHLLLLPFTSPSTGPTWEWILTASLWLRSAFIHTSHLSHVLHFDSDICVVLRGWWWIFQNSSNHRYHL